MEKSNKAITTHEPAGIPLGNLLAECRKHEAEEMLLTGLPLLDKACGGLPAVGLTVIGGRPAMGTTMLALNMAMNMSVGFGIPTAYVSSDNQERILARRVMDALEGCVGSKIEIDGVDHSIAEMLGESQVPLYLQTRRMDSEKVFADYCRQLVEKRGVRVIFIDKPGDMVHFTGYHEFYDLGRLLRRLAMELEVCIVAVSGLSRSLEMRGGDKRPMLCDIQDGLDVSADEVLLLYRPEYYGIEENEYGLTHGLAEVAVLKGRRTQCTVRLGMEMHFGFFYDLEDKGRAAIDLLTAAIVSKGEWWDELREDYYQRFGKKSLCPPSKNVLYQHMCKENPFMEDFSSIF